MNAKKVMLAVIISVAGACFSEKAFAGNRGTVGNPSVATVQPGRQLSSVSGPVVYLSGLKSEIKWLVYQELRNSGYTPVLRSKDALRLRMRMRKLGKKIICLAIMYDQEGRVVSQGIGETNYWSFRVSGRFGRIMAQQRRYNAEKKAALAAVKSLIGDYLGGP